MLPSSGLYLRISQLIDPLPRWKQAIVYQYLHNAGLTIVDCPRLIKEGLKEEDLTAAQASIPTTRVILRKRNIITTE